MKHRRNRSDATEVEPVVTEQDCKTCAKSIPSLPFKHQPPRQHEELLGGAINIKRINPL